MLNVDTILSRIGPNEAVSLIWTLENSYMRSATYWYAEHLKRQVEADKVLSNNIHGEGYDVPEKGKESPHQDNGRFHKVNPLERARRACYIVAWVQHPEQEELHAEYWDKTSMMMKQRNRPTWDEVLASHEGIKISEDKKAEMRLSYGRATDAMIKKMTEQNAEYAERYVKDAIALAQDEVQWQIDNDLVLHGNPSDYDKEVTVWDMDDFTDHLCKKVQPRIDETVEKFIRAGYDPLSDWMLEKCGGLNFVTSAV